VLVAVAGTAVNALPSSMAAPGAKGQAWYVCQGYNGKPSHTGAYALDLTASSAEVSTNGCLPGGNATEGKPVYLPATGRLYWVDSAHGAICLNLVGGGSLELAHMDGYPTATGKIIYGGTKVGTVAAAGKRANNGVAHLHIQVWSTSNCKGTQVPFDTAHQARLACSPDMTANGTVNQWRKAKIYNCGTGTIGGVSMQEACDVQYPNQGRKATVLRSTDAYSWSCVSSSGSKKPIDASRECGYHYASDAYALAANSQDPYSWYCKR
jgi:hypothetical protein